MPCHHRSVPIEQILLTLTIHPYQQPFLVSNLDGNQSPHRADKSKFLLVGQHWCVSEGVHSQGPACLVHLTWIVCEMEGKWLSTAVYSEQQAGSLWLPSSFFSIHLTVQPYSSTVMDTAWKICSFILSVIRLLYSCLCVNSNAVSSMKSMY